MQVNTIRKSVIILLVIGAIVLVLNWKFDLTGKKGVQEQIAKIHATKLTLADVMGDNLPPDPGAAADATIAGIDANKNGIRDDVELAVFKAYPNSAKIRAVLLQYALALQMEFTQPIIKTETVIAVAQERSRAASCIGDAVSRDDIQKFVDITRGYDEFLKNNQINNESRIKADSFFWNHLGSYSDLENQECDLDLSTLPK
jgi:hypothetical protein